MTQEDKNLLLQDLCARLPYEVKAYVKNWSKLDRKYYEDIYDVKSAFPSLNEVHVQSKSGSLDVLLGYYDYDIKPYLFPLSSMTEEERIAIGNEFAYGQPHKAMDILHKRHIDYRGLIPKGLAIDATGLNIYCKGND